MSTQKKGHGKHDSDIQCLYLIQNEVQKRLVHTGESSFCSCNICLNAYELKEKGKAFLRQTSSILKVDSVKMQQFFGLLSSIDAKTFFRMDIAEICFFSKGQIKRAFKSNNSGIHKLEISPAFKKNVVNFFLDQRKTMTNSKQLSNETNKLTHIKHFSEIIPSYKHGESLNSKTPKSFIFHNNQKYEEEVINVGKTTAEEICIVKYKDKGFELINEKQLRQLANSFLSMQSVDFIQKYIKPSDGDEQFFYANYNMYDVMENAFMFKRSEVHVKLQLNLINTHSKDFIPVEHLDEYEQLLKNIPQQYCLYSNYKMIHYMELAKDVKVSKLNTVWLKDESKQIVFFGLVEFEWEESQKQSIDVSEIYELKQLVNSQLTDFEEELLQAWEKMKDRKKKVEEIQEIDKLKEQEFEKIKVESSMRLQLKSKKKKSSRKQ